MDFEYERDEEGGQTEYQTVREGIVFCIDASDKMFEGGDDDGLCYLQRCFKCIRDRMIDNIMVSDKEFVGIALLGAQATDAAPVFSDEGTAGGPQTTSSDVALLFKVSRPGAEILKLLNSYLSSNNFPADFREQFSHVDYSLPEALWYCQSLVSMSSIKFGPKELLLITCDDQSNMPVATQRQAFKRADALMQVGVSLRLLFLGDNFNLNDFYKELLMAAHPWSRDDFEADAVNKIAINIDKFPKGALSRSSLNRQLFRLDWNLTEETAMTVILYALYRKKEAYESKKIIKLDQRSNVEVRASTARFDNETGDLVAPGQMFKGIEIGGRSAIFSMEERNNVRNIYPPGLVLLGFKPISEVNLDDFVKPGMFVQPDDAARAGSSTLFFALLQRCIEREKVPFCRLVVRGGSGVRLVYLLPQKKGDETLGALGIPGFHIVFAPFTGECRACGPERSNFVSSETQQVLAAKIIKKIKIRYQPEQFNNPEVETYFAAVEAMALEYDRPKEVIDSIVPDVEGIDARLGNLAQEFLTSVSQSFNDSDSESKSSISASRSRGSQGGSGRGRATENDEIMDFEGTGTFSQSSGCRSRGGQVSRRGRSSRGVRGRGKVEDINMEDDF